jgi:hypothetical protein
VGAEGDAFGGKAHRPGDRFAGGHERDMNSPVGASGLAELPRSVEGVDDPDASTVEPAGVWRRLFGEPRIVWELCGERGNEELVRATVALCSQHVRVTFRVTNAEQQAPRLLGDSSRELVLALADRRLGHGCRHVFTLQDGVLHFKRLFVKSEL